MTQKQFCYRKTKEFLSQFERRNGSILCRTLLKADFDPDSDIQKQQFKAFCPQMVASAVQILKSMDFDAWEGESA